MSLKGEDIDRVFDINCRSVFMLTQKVMQYLIENQGKYLSFIFEEFVVVVVVIVWKSALLIH